MARRFGITLALLVTACSAPSRPASVPSSPQDPALAIRWGLVIHGGAGVITRAKLTPEREAAIREMLAQALREGHAILARGGSSLDAVTRTIVLLEDSPLFNAGTGAVFTHDGTNELDAAIMVGTTRAAGSVAGVRTVKNPILLARALMERSPHVMLVGAGADAFAVVAGVERVEPAYFFTPERWQQLQDKLAAEQAAGAVLATPDDKLGTVGAVALDHARGLAAGTSTGGTTNKRYGRVGDSPVIGAGTYADTSCAVSATGHGEHFIRHAVAHEICARRAYLRLPLARAAHEVVMEDLVKVDGEGGVIALDRDGHVAMPFNSPGMYRGYIGEDGVPHVMIFVE
ncbi:MAG: isoaspartyl peptidase/L-asparaginase [Deltaproteobacteria bacterium]|nr:isoaspartyl peptidase/L-asparaginase [Deltaproteobacteria bacterium]MDQ3297051.1 isoaspartyl peptidase/L-asparaginase [Myxococcota bacterium]